MESKDIILYYDGNEHKLKRIPKTFQALKKQISEKINLENNSLILLGNKFGAKIPVSNNSNYARAVKSSEIINIEVLPGEQTDNESELNTDFVFASNKERVFLTTKSRQMHDEKEDIPEDEMCIICYSRKKEPMSANCGHICCKACWMKILSNCLECPLCKQRVRMKHLTPIQNKPKN
ncbi:hypothetical protein SteCoe_2272 [Stentor coeruleus]|uniref:RING-type domain-containing protein n=1 Tax=Stentor coeruleus TaxID=5963 RepID=A0A1R2CZU3_9CILI|nr:hypothetical protein SteCoe_2272 [Stentor coeruleus]